MAGSYKTMDEFLDFTKGTLAKYQKNKWEDISQALQRFECVGTWWNNYKDVNNGGNGMKGWAKTETDTSGGFVGELEKDNVILVDLMSEYTIPRYAKFKDGWLLLRSEVLQNSNEHVLFNIMLPRRFDKFLNAAQTWEDALFDTSPSTTDTKKPYSLFYHIARPSAADITANTRGFYGKLPLDTSQTDLGFSDVLGIDPSTKSGWRNWTSQYSVVTYNDLIEEMDYLCDDTMWESPTAYPNASESLRQNLRFYVNQATNHALKKLYRSQNDNLGYDLGVENGMVVFRGHPVVWVPKMDSDTTNPVIGVDHSTFRLKVLEGNDFYEQEPLICSWNSEAVVNYLIISAQTACINRRRNGIIIQG